MIIRGGLFDALLATVALIQRDMVLFSVNSSIVLFLAWLVYYLRKKKNYNVIAIFGTIVTGVYYLFLIAHGGVEETAYLWVLTYPLIVLYLLGKYLGSLLSFAVFVLSAVVFFLGSEFDIFQYYSIRPIYGNCCSGKNVCKSIQGKGAKTRGS